MSMFTPRTTIKRSLITRARDVFEVQLSTPSLTDAGRASMHRAFDC